MSELIERLSFYLSLDFVIYALIVSVLIALCTSLLGVVLVLKRFAQIGTGLSNVAFCQFALASVTLISNEMYITLPVTIICAILLMVRNEKHKTSGDAIIAMISVGALALGYLLVSVFAKGPNVSGDVCSTLFGSTSILTLTKGKVIACVILSVVVLTFFILYYHKIYVITFDETFAKTTNINVLVLKILIAIITALVIVLAMNLVGSLLITALIVFPTISSMHLFKTFKQVTISSCIICILCSVLGIFISMFEGTPVGSTIVVTNIIVYLLCLLVSRLVRRIKG